MYVPYDLKKLICKYIMTKTSKIFFIIHYMAEESGTIIFLII